MKVRELIELLKGQPQEQEAVVYVYGAADCIPIVGVKSENGRVELEFDPDWT